MPIRTHSFCAIALLLAIVLLGAQLHFCADVTGSSTGTHICPVCSALGAAVVTPSPVITVMSAVRSLEAAATAIAPSSDIPRATSPRAPPAS